MAATQRLTLGYFLTTALFSIGMLVVAVSHFFPSGTVVFPYTTAWLLAVAGIGQCLGVVAILLPGSFPRIREWAYAGLLLATIESLFMAVAAGSSFSHCLFLLAMVLVGMASYFLHHKRKARRIKRRWLRSFEGASACFNACSPDAAKPLQVSQGC